MVVYIYTVTTMTNAMQALIPVTTLIRQARQGVLRRRVDEIAQLVGLTDKEMARILNMSVRGLHGKTDSEQLSLSASERLLLLERLIQHGLAVFDGRVELFSRWLRTPLAELAYREGPDDTDELAEPPSVRAMGSFAEPIPAYQRAAPVAGPRPTGVVVPQSPLAVLDTVSGFSLADDVLGRIDWGLIG